MINSILMKRRLLKKLAVDYCNCFLDVKKKNGESLERVIGLYGADKKILTRIKGHMRRYFQKKGEEVQIDLGNCSYEIDVGFFQRINKSLREV